MSRYRACNTEIACIDSNAPMIKQIELAFGFDCVQAYIESWIVNLRLFFNVGRAMNDVQTFETAQLIVETFPYLNIADVNLVFKRAKIGHYGKIYDRLDGNVIIDWFNQYFNERCNAAAQRSQREADTYRMRCPDSKERTEEIVRRVFKQK